MKLFYIANSRIPTKKAHGYQIAKMCESFVKAGMSVDLILPTRKQLKEENIFDYYELDNNFNFKKIRCLDPRFLLRFPAGIYIKVQILFFGMSLFFYLLKMKDRDEKVFYTREEYLLPILHIFSKKVVWEAHNMPKHRLMYLRDWHKCYKIISITKGLKEELSGLGIEENKILVASDGVDIAKFNIEKNKKELREDLGLPKEKKIILYTGHLYPWKGVDVLAKTALKFDKEFLFIFVGGSESRVKEFRTKYKSNNILVLGHKPHKEIPKYLKAADILVLPNSAKEKISEKYTSPLKMFEYMVSGVPIIASDLQSIREILNKDNAVLTKADDVDNLKKSIEKVIKDKDLTSRISKKAYADAQQYSWQNRACKIINFIKF